LILKLYTVVDSFEKEKDSLENEPFTIEAINGLLNYFTETQKVKLEHINKIKVYEVQKYMALDINARRSLELTERMRDKSKKGTLIWVLDKTSTSMGGRLLRRWINDPLLDIEEITQRHEAVRELKDNLILREELINILTEKIRKEDSYFNFSTTKDLYNKAKITLNLNEIQIAYKLYTYDTMYEVDKYVLDQMLEMYQEIQNNNV
jgi:DNA mismatch repair ATPase MutS